MRIKHPIVMLFVVTGCLGVLWWLMLRSGKVESPSTLMIPTKEADAVRASRDQLTLQVSKTHATLDEQLTFTMRLRNIAEAEVFVITGTKIREQRREEDDTFFLQVEPLTLSLFGITPSGPYDRRVVFPDGSEFSLRRLAPGELDVTEWQGAFRQVLNGLVVPIEQQKAGEYAVRATYLGKCPSGASSVKILCNSVTSEWVKIQIQG